MKERFVVKNNINGPLNLIQNKIFFKKGGEVIDLVSYTGMSVSQLEANSEVTLQIAHKNLVVLEKVQELVSSDLMQKMEELIQVVSTSSNVQQSSSSVNISDDIKQVVKQQVSETIKQIMSGITITSGKEASVKESSISDEDLMRDEAMHKLVGMAKKPDKNFEDLGISKTVENEADGNENLIDF